MPKNQTYVYTYDNSGNLTSKKIYSLTAQSSTPSGTYTTKSYSYSTGTWGDLLTSFNGGSITYDGIGNPTKYYDGKTFTWEGRRLVGAVNGSTTMSFTYNDEGMRTSKTVAGVTTNYYYNGSQLISEETNGKVKVYLYNSTGVIGFRYRTSSYGTYTWDTFFYEKNMQGDITAVYASTGVKKISYTYDAWGNAVTTYYNGASATNLANPFTYRGYYYDSDLGLYYLNSRYYDSNTGRFISPDLPDVVTATPHALTDKNLYAYCDNNPVMRTDGDGEFWLGIAIGALVGAVTQYISDIVYNAASGETGADVFKPYSSVVDYVSAAASGALLGAPIGTKTSQIANTLIDLTAYCINIYQNDEEFNSLYALGIIGSNVLLAKPGVTSSDFITNPKYSRKIIDLYGLPKRTSDTIFDIVNIYKKRLPISGGVSAFKGVAERFKEMFN